MPVSIRIFQLIPDIKIGAGSRCKICQQVIFPGRRSFGCRFDLQDKTDILLIGRTVIPASVIRIDRQEIFISIIVVRLAVIPVGPVKSLTGQPLPAAFPFFIAGSEPVLTISCIFKNASDNPALLPGGDGSQMTTGLFTELLSLRIIQRQIISRINMSLISDHGCRLVCRCIRKCARLRRFHGDHFCRLGASFRFCLRSGFCLRCFRKICCHILFRCIFAVRQHVALIVGKPAVQIFFSDKEPGTRIIVHAQCSVCLLYYRIETHSIIKIQCCHGTVKLTYRKRHMINGCQKISCTVVLISIPGNELKLFQYRRHLSIRDLIPGDPAGIRYLICDLLLFVFKGIFHFSFIWSEKLSHLCILRRSNAEMIIAQTLYGITFRSTCQDQTVAPHGYLLFPGVRSHGNSHLIAVGNRLFRIHRGIKLIFPGTLHITCSYFRFRCSIKSFSCCSVSAPLFFLKDLF